MSQDHDKSNPDIVSTARQAAQLIRDHQEPIMEQWLDAVVSNIPSARAQGRSELADHLLDLLHDITGALESVGDKLDSKRVESLDFIVPTSKQHGRERATVDGISVADLVKEYILLRQVITGYCTPRHMPNQHTLDIISRVIENASLAGVDEFVRSMQEVQQKLIASLVHDVRTPLSVAHNYVELFDVLPEEQRQQALPTISRNLKRAINMMEELLDLTKLRAGSGLLLHFEECDLAAAILTLCEETRLIYDREIRPEFDQRSIKGVFDMAMVLRTVENLVSNAVKFGDRETPIGISLQDLGERVRLTVHNFGEPIPSSHIDDIFDFFQSPKPSIGERKGWGLGLALIKHVANSHGGRVVLESDREKGTTVGMELKKHHREPGEEITVLI